MYPERSVPSRFAIQSCSQGKCVLHSNTTLTRVEYTHTQSLRITTITLEQATPSMQYFGPLPNTIQEYVPSQCSRPLFLPYHHSVPRIGLEVSSSSGPMGEAKELVNDGCCCWSAWFRMSLSTASSAPAPRFIVGDVRRTRSPVGCEFDVDGNKVGM